MTSENTPIIAPRDLTVSADEFTLHSTHLIPSGHKCYVIEQKAHPHAMLQVSPMPDRATFKTFLHKVLAMPHWAAIAEDSYDFIVINLGCKHPHHVDPRAIDNWRLARRDAMKRCAAWYLQHGATICQNA